MEYNKSYNYNQGNATDVPSVFAKVMRNVYTWMACGLAMTALAALIVADSPGLVYTIVTNKLLFWGLLGGELGLVLWLSARIAKMSFVTAGIMFALYAILNGITMSYIFMAYTMESIATTFFTTAGTFAVMSVIGYVVKKDLSGMGRFLIMLLVGLIIASVVNIFVASSGLALILNYVGVIIFVGLTAYDTQKIKLFVQEASYYGSEENTNKVALIGSLTLYLDFVNLFLYLLRFMGNRK